jgi:hypothetical protein
LPGERLARNQIEPVIPLCHRAGPQRLARVLIAGCLAYIWMIHLGTLCQQHGWCTVIHRTDRCDLSLFQLGLDLLYYFENHGVRFPVDFKPYREPLPSKRIPYSMPEAHLAYLQSLNVW